MEVIVASRGLKASAIVDIAFDLGLQSPKIVTSEEWGGTRMHTLTFGPLAYRQTIQIPGKLQEAEIRGILELEAAVQKMPIAKAAEPVEMTPVSVTPKRVSPRKKPLAETTN